MRPTGWVDHTERVLSLAAEAQTALLELQADYFAGVWAHHGQKQFNFLEAGDIDVVASPNPARGQPADRR